MTKTSLYKVTQDIFLHNTQLLPKKQEP